MNRLKALLGSACILFLMISVNKAYAGQFKYFSGFKAWYSGSKFSAEYVPNTPFSNQDLYKYSKVNSAY